MHCLRFCQTESVLGRFIPSDGRWCLLVFLPCSCPLGLSRGTEGGADRWPSDGCSGSLPVLYPNLLLCLRWTRQQGGSLVLVLSCTSTLTMFTLLFFMPSSEFMLRSKFCFDLSLTYKGPNLMCAFTPQLSLVHQRTHRHHCLTTKAEIKLSITLGGSDLGLSDKSEWGQGSAEVAVFAWLYSAYRFSPIYILYI